MIQLIANCSNQDIEALNFKRKLRLTTKGSGTGEKRKNALLLSKSRAAVYRAVTPAIIASILRALIVSF
jgi:hypothetical protein